MVENSFFPRFFGLFGPFFSFFFGPTSVIFKKKVLATLTIIGKKSIQIQKVNNTLVPATFNGVTKNLIIEALKLLKLFISFSKKNYLRLGLRFEKHSEIRPTL